MTAPRLARAFATVSGLTGLSRILGFIRDQMLGAFIGPGVVLDAWQAAFALPNVFRRLFAEGAMSAAFVPLLRAHLSSNDQPPKDSEQAKKEAQKFARAAFSFLLLILSPLSALMILTMPWIVDLITGFADGSRAQVLAILFGRIMIPYLLLMSLMALVGGVLDALGRFAAKAFAPALLNIILIVILMLIAVFDLAPGIWLSWAALIAGFAQLAAVWIPAARMGWAPSLTWPFQPSHKMGLFVRRMIPGLIANGGYQFSFLIVLALASSVEQDLSHRYFADRLYQLPLGLIGIALNTVLLSSLSTLIAQRQDTAALNQLNRALELAWLLALPLTLACLFQAEFLFTGLFQVGQFTADDSAGAALALIGFAFGIPAAVGQKVLQPAFFARQDTRRPMIHALASVGVAVVLSYALYPHLGLFGLSLAAAISSWSGFLSLGLDLIIRGHFRPDRRLGVRLIPMALSAGAMVLGLAFTLTLIGDLDQIAFHWRLPLTLSLILASALVYFSLCLILRAIRASHLRQFLRQV